LLIHPDRLLAVLDDEAYGAYVAKRELRETRQFRYAQGVASGRHTLVQVKSKPPYSEDNEANVYLDASARARYDAGAKTWLFGPAKPAAGGEAAAVAAVAGGTPEEEVRAASSLAAGANPPQQSAATRLAVAMQEKVEGLAAHKGLGVGVDVEPLSTFADLAGRWEFIARNFTPREIEHCQSAADPRASFAGRWAAKEAVVKALSNAAPQARSLWSGPGAPLVGIEILQASSGAPVVVLHDHAKEVAQTLGVSEIKVSISHAGDVAVAQALAQ
jgi:phosphopantetheine--protein transferase-like protein